MLVAWTEEPFAHVVDYGRIEVPSDSMGVESATMVALRQFRDMVKSGWPIGTPEGERMQVDFSLVDAGYLTDVVYAFALESGTRFVPSVGRGAGQQHNQHMGRITTTGATTVNVGDGKNSRASQSYAIPLEKPHFSPNRAREFSKRVARGELAFPKWEIAAKITRRLAC